VLRVSLIVGSAVVLIVAAVLIATGRAVPGLGAIAFWALVLLGGILFERRRYKRVLDAPLGPDWAPTSERFIDPETGAELTVYFNAKTGRREYVRSQPPPAQPP
jgi:hypothetical protein